jgi:hypothetical protein
LIDGSNSLIKSLTPVDRVARPKEFLLIMNLPFMVERFIGGYIKVGDGRYFSMGFLHMPYGFRILMGADHYLF